MMNSFKYGVIRFFRSYMAPIDPVTAEKWYTRLRMFYLFGAFQIVVFTIYKVQKNKLSQKGYEVEEPYADKVIRVMGLKNVTVLNYNLQGKQSTYVADADELKQRYEVEKAKVYEKYSV